MKKYKNIVNLGSYFCCNGESVNKSTGNRCISPEFNQIYLSFTYLQRNISFQFLLRCLIPCIILLILWILWIYYFNSKLPLGWRNMKKELYREEIFIYLFFVSQDIYPISYGCLWLGERKTRNNKGNSAQKRKRSRDKRWLIEFTTMLSLSMKPISSSGFRHGLGCGYF